MFYVWFPGFVVPGIMVLCGALQLAAYPLKKKYTGSQRDEGDGLYRKNLWQVGFVLLAMNFMVMRSVRLLGVGAQKPILVAAVVLQLVICFGLRYYVEAMLHKPVDSVTEKAYTKLNLTLEIGEKREDGYHELRSVMTCCDLHDTLTVEKAEELTMTCDDETLSCGEDNLCIRAAKAFFADACIEGGCHISLQKLIPMQAGLGGGSADAAAVLRALRRLYAPEVEDSALEQMAQKLGSDVPFCVRSETALCGGRGEQLTPQKPLPQLWYVIVKPDAAHPTGAMYAALDQYPDRPERTTEALLKAIERRNRKDLCANIRNDFHLALPEDSPVLPAMEKLRELHAKAVAMSGSGSAVFGVYDNRYKAKVACMLLQEQGYRAFLAKSV